MSKWPRDLFKRDKYNGNFGEQKQTYCPTGISNILTCYCYLRIFQEMKTLLTHRRIEKQWRHSESVVGNWQKVTIAWAWQPAMASNKSSTLHNLYVLFPLQNKIYAVARKINILKYLILHSWWHTILSAYQCIMPLYVLKKTDLFFDTF